MRQTLSDTRALITGAASGLGLHTALGLARLGARVIVADRNIVGGQAAVQRINEEVAGNPAQFRALDLADLSLIRRFADTLVAEGRPLDILVNNAGLLPPQVRATTRDGFELKFGISHLGHYALTGLLLPALLRSARPRVVSVSSIAHSGGRLDFDDLQGARRYTAMGAYANTKLACLMYAMELQRRADAAGIPLLSLAAHPGISRTSISQSWKDEDRSSLRARMETFSFNLAMRWFSQSAEQGAAPILHAASAPDVLGGAYYGPGGFQQFAGPPKRVQPKRKAFDIAVAQRLWTESETLTGVRYEALYASG